MELFPSPGFIAIFMVLCSSKGRGNAVIETSTPAGAATHTAVAASSADESSSEGGELDLDGIDDLEIDKVTTHAREVLLL